MNKEILRMGAAALAVVSLGLEKALPISAAEQNNQTPQTEEKRPELEPWAEDIFITAMDVDPQNPNRILAVNTHPSMSNWPPRIFEGIYNITTQEYIWRPVSETFPGWRVQGITISPTDPNTWVVCGSDPDIFNVNRGFARVTRNNGSSFTNVSLGANTGNVFGCTFLKDGSGFLTNASNNEGTAGILRKYDISGNQVSMANNGLSNVSFSLGRTVEVSPNNIDTYYVISGSNPAILKTINGGNDWSTWINASSPPNPWTFKVFNSNGEDGIVVSGVGWVDTKIGNNSVVTDWTTAFDSMAVDISGSEPRIYGASGSSGWISERLLSGSWQTVSNIGLPPESLLHPLSTISVVGDNKKYLASALVKPGSNNGHSGFWKTDITTNANGGTWIQNVNGLQPRKLYLPLVVRSYAGGW